VIFGEKMSSLTIFEKGILKSFFLEIFLPFGTREIFFVTWFIEIINSTLIYLGKFSRRKRISSSFLRIDLATELGNSFFFKK
jgi:hypothetical protein